MTFAPTLKSLNAHEVPPWYEDAKFGIFIHWGLYSIPGFASRFGSITDVFRDHYDIAVASTPYTEWYCNAIKVPECESAKHHRDVWHDMPYENFREMFLKGLEQWSPAEWADSFATAGARYVVLVTKHHDGFCLWPSTVDNPHQKDWTSRRDIVGELAQAVRARGMRFGVYYSGGIDWTFNREPLRTLADFIGSMPGGDYPRYADAQMHELIARYKPSVVWNDIAWPTPLQPELQLFADYYIAVPDVVVDDRWQPANWMTVLMRIKLVRRIFDFFAKRQMTGKNAPQGVVTPKPPHYDFRTMEYTTFSTAQAGKWEATRGMSFSFGFNRRDTEADYLSIETLVREFVDTVSKNGNLLLNVGPRGEDAQIPSEQAARLKGLGDWLKANGEGIYGTRPWAVRAEGQTSDGTQVRFTAKPGALYAHLLGTPDTPTFFLQGGDLPPVARAVHLASGAAVAFRRDEGGYSLTLSQPLEPSPVQAFRLDLLTES